MLVEYFDDFELSRKIMNQLFGTTTDDSVDEKFGEARLGGKSIMDSFGLTLLVATLVLAVFVALVILALYIINRTGYQGKFKQRILSLKQQIFYNMLIAMILLNGLKSYILALTTLNRSDSDTGSKILAVILLLLYLALPYFFARMLYKQEKKLTFEEQ